MPADAKLALRTAETAKAPHACATAEHSSDRPMRR